MNPFGSLSVRLLVLTVVVVLMTELLVFLPGLAQERRAWLREHVQDADIAALAVAIAPDGMIDPRRRDELLRLSNAEMIRLREPGGPLLALSTSNQAPPDLRVDMRRETIPESVARAVAELFMSGNPRLMIISQSQFRPEAVIEVIVPGHRLFTTLRQFAGANVTEWLVIAGVTGLLMYIAVVALLVRPLRRMTGSIAAFRAAPERAPAVDPAASGPVGGRAGDEIAIAARELAAMQSELRTALWRNARLAALGTALAKVSHDVRGILSAAMLAADRLTMHDDPAVRRSGEVVVRAVERATELVRQTLAYAREGPPPLSLSCQKLRDIVTESVEQVPGFVVHNQVPAELEVEVDRVALFRVLSNLFRNAQQAGAGQLTVSAGSDTQATMILVADDGPGLSEAAQAKLFQAFSGSKQSGGSGLGLAIARDLMRAHGGDVVLEQTGEKGTMFRLMLPLPEGAEAK